MPVAGTQFLAANPIPYPVECHELNDEVQRFSISRPSFRPTDYWSWIRHTFFVCVVVRTGSDRATLAGFVRCAGASGIRRARAEDHGGANDAARGPSLVRRTGLGDRHP